VSDRPDELRRQLSTLWQAARTGFDTMREVVYRSSQAGRLRFDIAMMQRERSQLLRQLGEQTCCYLDQDGGALPEELHQLHDRIRDVESRIKTNSVKVFDNAFGAPRGFEPEAAEDYGDEHGVAEPVEDRMKTAPATQAARRRRVARRKVRVDSKH
jgi:hypothetical protein